MARWADLLGWFLKTAEMMPCGDSWLSRGLAGTIRPFAALLCTRNQERRRSRGKQDPLRKGGQRAYLSFNLKARHRGRKRRGCGTSKLHFSNRYRPWQLTMVLSRPIRGELSTRKPTMIRKQERVCSDILDISTLLNHRTSLTTLIFAR